MNNFNYIKKTKFNSGQVFMLVSIFFVFISLLIMFGILDPLTRRLQIISSLNSSIESYYLAESVHEDAIYRLMNSMNADSPVQITIDGVVGSAVITDNIEGKNVLSTGAVRGAYRKVRTNLIEGEGIAFNYGAQSDAGGIKMEQSASIVGNVYSNGSIEGHQPGSKSTIAGSVVSAGASGYVANIHATGTIHSHTIEDSYIEKDAYYDTDLINTTVDGDVFHGSPDEPTLALPIEQTQIDNWKANAESGGVITCNNVTSHVIDYVVTLGPNKIPCDLIVEKSGTVLALAGNLWVEGDVTVQQSAIIEVDSSLGSKSAMIIADNPAEPQTSGIVNLRNNTEFNGNGNDGSYVMFLSENTSAKEGGATAAISLDNKAVNDVLLYADSGLIELTNSADIKELTGYALLLRNSVEVTYESGLASLLFDSGPGGGFQIDSWEEVE